MSYTIAYIGGPRAGKTESRGFMSAPRAIVCNADELEAKGEKGHYQRKEVDDDVKVAVYKWHPAK